MKEEEDEGDEEDEEEGEDEEYDEDDPSSNSSFDACEGFFSLARRGTFFLKTWKKLFLFLFLKTHFL